MKRFALYLLFAVLMPVCVWAQDTDDEEEDDLPVYPGAYDMNAYLPMLQGKKVGIVMNQTSEINRTSLLDTLLAKQVKVKKVYTPEHGFRGLSAEGETVENGVDTKTQTPIISLYGNNKKPTNKQLKGIDVMIFDLQDVGVRFYTYISTLEYVMQACAENDIHLIVLDRPNPNGFYIDGPVLDTSLRSFVGMQPVPIVYGMTIGEYAKMIHGEGWAKGTENLKMDVILCKNYEHFIRYKLPVAPSPNLPNATSILCYPSLCLMEGTVMSVGRGSDKPFQQWGHPSLKGKTSYYFTPVPYWGQKTKPLYAYEDCYGQLAAMNESDAYYLLKDQLRLLFIQKAYYLFPEKAKFFNDYFEKLAGTRELRRQIEKGVKEEDIKASWKKDIEAFKKIRKKYVLYKDFE